MNDPLDALDRAVAALRATWSGDGPMRSARDLDRATLLAVNDAIGVVRRQVDAAHAAVAAEIARESRSELGKDGLARRAGFRTPATLIAATTGTTAGEASRLVAVGEAVAPRVALTGESIPPRHPHVASALAAGRIGAPAAGAIVAMLDVVALRADRDALDVAESALVEQAPGLTLDQLAKVIARAHAHLDPDGVEPREDVLRQGRSLVFREDRSGRLVMTATFDPETGAPVRVAIEGLVTDAIRRRDPHGPETDRRTVAQLQADALSDLCRHALGCSASSLPLATTTVVVRITLEDLESGRGHGTIDGVAQPVSVATVRRIAAGGNIIPCVLGGESEVLDWGRAKRLFTPAQKLALAERDGGCAFCGLPPGLTEAHHIRWWTRDEGTTDLDNGILLCTRCHHRVHDDGWEIAIAGKGTKAKVSFIPPVWLDASRTPRPGGRARFDFALAS